MVYKFVWLFKCLLLLFTLRPCNYFSCFSAFKRDKNGINSQKMYYTLLTHLKSPGHNPIVGMKYCLCVSLVTVMSTTYVNFHLCLSTLPVYYVSLVLKWCLQSLQFSGSAQQVDGRA